MGVRPHFGVYLSSVEEACQSGIWRGISQFAADFGVGITVFISTYQQRVGSLHCHYEVTRDFASHAKLLDGMIFLGGPVMDGVGGKEAEAYYAHFANIPIVNISMEYGDTSLLVDNRQGMRLIIEHLIDVHKKRRIAFVQGPEGHREADERFIAYCEVLHEHGLKVDESLVCRGKFTERSGRDAVRLLVDERHVSFDAVVAVDDETAMGVFSALQERNILVPDDVAVTGFDDIEMAEAHAPSLTTVKQPFFNLGYAGARQLLDNCIDEKNRGVTTLKPELVTRQSCGCVPREVVKRYSSDDGSLRELKISLSETLHNSAGVPLSIAEEWFTELSTYLVQIPEGEELFLRKFDHVLTLYRFFNSDLSIWQRILSEFQASMSKLFMDNSERLVQISSLILKSSWLIHGALRSEDKRQEIDGSRTQWEIRGIAHDIMTAFDFNDLYGKIESGFRELGIKGAIVGLYNRPVSYLDGWEAPEEIRILMAFNERKRFVEVSDFKKIMIHELLELEHEYFSDRTRTSLFMPLFFGDEQLGMVLIEENRDMPVDMYETLRLALSTAVKGAALLGEVKELSIKDELTGLYNRRGFLTLAEPRMNHLRRRKDTASLLFIDLDRLKEINDTYGHSEGDWAISQTARILSQATRNGDILARLGGDEFVLFASNPEGGGVLEITERVRKAFAHFNDEVSKRPYRIECSIGAGVAEVDEEMTLEELMERADAELYVEKERKRS